MVLLATVEQAIREATSPQVWAQGVLACAVEDETLAKTAITSATPEQRVALVGEINRQSDLMKRFKGGAPVLINKRGCSLVIRERPDNE